MIKLENVQKTFDKTIILKDINWDVERGQVVGLVGPNGSGKSTLLRLICGVLKPDGGRASYDNQRIYDNPNVKRKIAFVSDEPFYFSGSNLEGMKSFYQTFYPTFDENTYTQLLHLFPVDPNKRISAFSKGMKRMTSLILNLASHPEVLLLDEAFDGLDPMMRLNLKRFLSDEIIDHQTSVIVSSHSLRELEDISDSIALIDNHSILLSQTLEHYHAYYHKIQLAFANEIDVQRLKELAPLHLEGQGKVYTLTIKGDLDVITQRISALNPAVVDELPLSLEELFIYEMEDRGYGKI